MKILELKNVSYKYEKTTKNVLKNINIDFELGKLYAVMGKSGSGKTTLLSLISGLDTATGGDILYKDKSIKSINRDDYRATDIGVIFQGYNLLTNATVYENIELSMNISGFKAPNTITYINNLLNSVGITKDMSKRKILKLSGGEQQRVGIARAISSDPNIIIADEPTGNLDSTTEDSIMQILKDLAHNKNKCVIVVTHSKNVATYADNIIELSI